MARLHPAPKGLKRIILGDDKMTLSCVVVEDEWGNLCEALMIELGVQRTTTEEPPADYVTTVILFTNVEARDAVVEALGHMFEGALDEVSTKTKELDS